MSEERRCLVIDAQPTVRLGVRDLLRDRYEVEEAEDWRAGVEMVTRVGDFDVAIVELARNGDDEPAPTTAIRALRRARSGLGIVAHAVRADRLAASDAIAAGATAFVAKSSSSAALEQAVDAAAEDQSFIDPAAGGLARNGMSLTRRQRQILQLFADGHATADVARRLELSSETVRTHTKAILARLGARDRAHAVAKGFRGGVIV